MDEYIERSVVVRRVMETKWERGSDGAAAMEIVASAPAADVAQVVHGKFVADESTYPGPGLENYKCSACGRINGAWRRGLKSGQFPNYCPNCGAKMDGGASE